MKFYSHKDKLIIEHLKEVRDLSKNNIPKDLENANNITSVCHDFGKYTTYFQEYLFSKDKNKSELSNHGFISAVFAAYAALCIYGKKTYMPYIIYNCVLHHHGSLENPSLDLPKDFSKIDENEDEVLLNKIDNCKKQLKDIKNNRKYIEKDYEELGFIDEFNSFLDKEPIEDTLLNIKKLDSIFDMKNKDEKFYFIHQLLYSALISADKISASNTYMPSIKYAEYEFLNKVKEDKFKNGELSKINKIRGEIFYNIQNELEKNYKDEKIFSITSPTGTGKTLSGFFAALKLKDLLKDNRKIIYSLPFTSIIDQNYESIYELLESIENFSKCENEYIIKHHNLSNVEYSSENENYDKNKAELLIENWTSGIVVTTFVQLLQTLIGNKNRMLKKFNSMRGAIILLDEIQAIDIKYLRLVDFILKGAVKYLDCRIIMMTATKPLILKESCELLYNNEEYFKMFNRTSIMPKINPITVEEFIEEFTNNIEEKSYLIICNTINQSLKIYDSLKNLDREVYYLSTNLLPFHRKNIINEVSYMLKKGENIILVSTQVVEAGVDFDFDVVIRDIGPMDSIIQAAGRCNRNGKKKNGEVYLYSMINDKEEY
ncbi:MAG: CRISPR-associated helicase Cas3', partial [Clostridium cochlearium]|uniref:CRISPR-associated helicase Cas3' n=2 Tax=Clostridium TaxID=1485 RepID=UPI0028FECFD9